MTFYLVAPSLEMAIELPLSEDVQSAIVLQLTRLQDRRQIATFAERLAQEMESGISEVLDWDIKKPTAAQASFALALSKELDVAIPAEAMNFRGQMHAFINEYAPLAKRRWAAKPKTRR
ncbi:hypothetical protein [Pseudoxanthomonas sp. SE1]|uniref:hypothetical protein n=1 Tax=Pseudoxanthomonas sp. SE1 TaxID=1664560 RepID=UPI00240CEA0C|nr:hypothetical protein [Pseudoxanthomonas sp. SE1]WFC42284.1 hypothetical protein OY559_01710 [Pseudoxanthomonas sp. SE1]